MSTARIIPANRTVYVEHQIVIIECAACSIDFGLGADFQQRRRDDHATFYCPNGHSNVYNGPSEAERLRKQLEYSRSAARAAEDQARAAEHRRRGEKAAKTRLKNRIAKGVCPCCKRSFVDVARHMEGQHPDFTEQS